MSGREPEGEAIPQGRRVWIWLLPVVLFIAFLAAWGMLFWLAAKHRPVEVERSLSPPGATP
jgi:hypothetical protein